MQLSVGKPRMYNGVLNRRPGVDLVIFDCPENLPVPGVSSPKDAVPTWNADEEFEALQSVFGFAKMHLQDDGCMIVFHSWCADSKGNIAGLCETYSMVKMKELMGVNRLHLTSAVDNTATVIFL